MDVPNHRSLHSNPTPRVGGLGILAGIAAGGLVPLAGIGWETVLLLAGALTLALLSFVDDRRGLPILLRFAVHGLAAAGVAWALAGGWWVALAVFLTVWATNLYNFMDGTDGLAGGMALFGFGACGIAAWLAQDLHLAALCLAIAGGAAGFLVFNLPPARVFMGDVGSIPLGFLMAGVGLAGIKAGNWPLFFPLLVFSPFVLDATITLLRRLLRGEKIWQAHREHYYQRMIRSGVGKRQTLLVWYALMLGCSASALWVRSDGVDVQAGVLLAWVGIYAVLAIAVDGRWRNRQGAAGV